jgi:hypothetical protein
MKRLILLLVVGFSGWWLWSLTGRSYEFPVPLDQNQLTVQKIVFDSLNKGNILAVQPLMQPEDYSSEQHFFHKMDAYLKLADENGLLLENTTVLLPEYLGTWLVVNQEKISVLKAPTLTSAMFQIVLSQPYRFFKSFRLHRNEQDKVAAAIFRMKAHSMADIYGNVFKALAKQYQVRIVAGSIILPEPQIVNNNIQVDPGQPLFNISVVFEASGKIHPAIVKKVFPIDSEIPFVTSGNTEDIPVFHSPEGTIGVLVCADSWYPEPYRQLKFQQAEVVLVSSYCSGNGTMEAKWQGYNGAEMPEDVDAKDIGSLTEFQAWQKYALPGRLASSGAKLGVNVFLSGQLWDLGSDGVPFFVFNNQILTGRSTHGIWSIRY